uniref:GYF domain-containing protein n=1 Tax=Arion vulgaris TaxID=1028688 RepID=A0A0B7A3V9_9EUPU
MAGNKDETNEKVTRFKEKHSLDSDEEDDNTKYDVLAEDDIEGQEEATIEFDDNIQITPFNMREELEEGHFDTDGTYIFDKTKEIHDNWIDNIDWVKVKHLKPEEANSKRPYEYGDDSDEESDEEKKKADTIETYQEILSILLDGETVAKAIRRLAKNKAKIPTASQKWRNKKQKTSGQATEENEEAVNKAIADQKVMLRLTELCDRLVQQGLIDIYETPYERMAFTLKHLTEKDQKSRLTIAESMKDDEALDMFADDFDSKEAVKTKPISSDDSSTENMSGDSNKFDEFKKPLPPITDTPSVEEAHDTILWEYKTENTDDSLVKGPFTSSQMMTWTDDGTFNKGVFCRRYQTQGQFYNSSRLDFDLYE